ncbi:MAG: Thioredoxin [Anaerolineales bacterium]|nr:Thioredoxin [Anaerolineales bacterium]
MHGLEAEWGDQVDFVYLDIDDSATEPFKRQLGYRVQPHMFLVDGDGVVLQQWLGFVDAATLEAALEQATG